jgi:hypothetical protein
MKLIRVLSNFNHKVKTYDLNLINSFSNIMYSQRKINFHPVKDFIEPKNLEEYIYDMNNTLEIVMNTKPYEMYVFSNSMYQEPDIFYIRSWIDGRYERKEGFCLIEGLKNDDIKTINNHLADNLSIENINFMLNYCRSIRLRD